MDNPCKGFCFKFRAGFGVICYDSHYKYDRPPDNGSFSIIHYAVSSGGCCVSFGICREEVKSITHLVTEDKHHPEPVYSILFLIYCFVYMFPVLLSAGGGVVCL